MRHGQLISDQPLIGSGALGADLSLAHTGPALRGMLSRMLEMEAIQENASYAFLKFSNECEVNIFGSTQANIGGKKSSEPLPFL
jgi:hypothetical protein